MNTRDLYCPKCGSKQVGQLACVNSRAIKFERTLVGDKSAGDCFCSQCERRVHPKDIFELWDDFSEVEVDEDDNILSSFLSFQVGTSKFDVWHWFDERMPNGLGSFLEHKII